MLRNKIKDIAKDSSIYGVSKILGQAISFFLIPLYTKYLSPEDYGVLNIMGLVIVSLSLLMNIGLDSATYRFVGMCKNEDEQKIYVGSAQLITIISIIVITILTIIFSKSINTFAIVEKSPIIYLFLAIINGVFASTASIPRAYLRINRKVKVIALASMLNVFGSIIPTLILVVYFQLGVKGAMIGGIIGTLLSSLYLVLNVPITSFKNFNLGKSKELLIYCLPALPTQIFAFAIPLYSQWSVKQILSLNELGLYAVSLKFTLPLTLMLTMFQQAYAPYKYQIIKTDKDPKLTFSRIMNLFVIGFGFLVIITTFFGGDLLKLMTTENYHTAAPFVFYMALIPFAQGLYFMFSSGLEFAKNPIYRPIISGAGLLTVLISNNWLIKHFGIPGAAISIVLSWLVMALGNLIYAQKLYSIKYKWFLILNSICFIFVIGFYVNTYFQNFIVFKILISGLIIISGTFYLNKKHNLLKILKF